MRLRKSKNAAEEQVVSLLNEGYSLLERLRSQHAGRDKAQDANAGDTLQAYQQSVNDWGDNVAAELREIFPTELEVSRFLRHNSRFRTVSADNDHDYKVKGLLSRIEDVLESLQEIRKEDIDRYTDLPVQTRLYVEDIDSFHKVRDVNPSVVADILQAGRLELSEDSIQMALEQILDVSFHKKDWGGEMNDLYTANVIVNGARVATAFLLKGNGLRNKVMEIGDCGKNGDQLVRLFDSPAQLFIVQFVGDISETLIKDVDGKVEKVRLQGKPVCYCIVNGQDTARVLHAHGKLSSGKKEGA
jgi:hypothetical protein